MRPPQSTAKQQLLFMIETKEVQISCLLTCLCQGNSVSFDIQVQTQCVLFWTCQGNGFCLQLLMIT